ncbi:MAG: ARMT1-like domain-containing protein [Coriobacteriales bacterium]|nr:ARMT1-like domain-containing protein [Coriobacteriales bacterium]
MSLEEITSDSLSPLCMRCMLDKYLDACPADIPWDEKADYMRLVLRTVAEGSLTMTAPEISHSLSGVLRDRFGIERDYTQLKWHFNELVLGLEDQMRERIAASDDALGLAIRCAIVGNLIDFGPTGNVSEAQLLQLVEDADTMELDKEALADFVRRIEQARTIAYLTDNCGEVVFDKLFIEQIKRVNPQAELVAIVRGAPTSNDATMEDALQVGLDTVVRVIGNGSNVAGTCPDLVNDETRAALRDSDLVISKGLANYETLSGRGQNIYFLFLCKCALYVESFGVPLYSGMVVRGV